jgi:glycosidase
MPSAVQTEIKALAEADLKAVIKARKEPYHPSPDAWEDQVLYFIMLDRFSDGREKGYKDNHGKVVASGTYPPFDPSQAGNVDRTTWESKGCGWCGGTLKGLEGKVGYLARMGIDALWISPIFKQVAFQPTYHGYGIQDFLDVDRHFGKRQDLQKLVKTAHKHGIRVILDIILNHSGNVFSYSDPGGGAPLYKGPAWQYRTFDVAGFNDQAGNPTLPFSPVPQAWPDGAVWPSEFQNAEVFTRKGSIKNWDFDPEFLEGDFEDLKNIQLGYGPTDRYQASPALTYLCEAYKYWMAYADIDGYRLDTVKHMDIGATRYFVSVIHEFAQLIGKERFYIIGEVTGGRTRAVDTINLTGLNAALGVDDIPDKLEYLVKGYRNPEDYFGLFRNSTLVGKESHTWFRNAVVNMYDDHDQVRKGKRKARFCAQVEADSKGPILALAAMAMQLTTLGIPCLYYGTEQGFNGRFMEERDGNDVFLRECMFGGEFGSFQSRGCHFFLEDNPLYQEIHKIIEIRKDLLALRRGRQYLREISGDGVNFGLPHMLGGQIRSVVPWSRIFDNAEILCAINTDCNACRRAWVTIDNHLNSVGERYTCLYSTDTAQIGAQIEVVALNGRALNLNVPPAGFVIYRKMD